MDAVLDVLLVLSLAGVIAYAFAVYEALKIMTAWAKAGGVTSGANAPSS